MKRPSTVGRRGWLIPSILAALVVLCIPAKADEHGPSLGATFGVVGVPIMLDWASTRHGLREGRREVGPLAREFGPDATAMLALGLETTAVQLVRRKNKRLAWGLLAGFAAGHLFIAGCNRARCW